MNIVEKVKKYLKEYNVSNTLLCALSGGCDSVVMTHIIHNLGYKVIAIHLNHNWRAAESQRDEEFSKEFAQNLGIEFYSEKLPNDLKKTELVARELRYNFFTNCAKHFKCNCVMLAHNQNDNVETLIYRVFKGTGLKGLCSIPKHRDIFYRPLLEVSREEIENYAKANSLKYVNDSSNNSTKYKRNFIRKEILPLAVKINPDASGAICNLIELANMQNEIICNVVSEIKSKIFEGDKIILDYFLDLSEPLKCEIINDFIGADLKYRDLKRIKSYVKFIQDKHKTPSKKSVNTDLFLEISDGYIFKSSACKKNYDEIAVFGEGTYNLASQQVVLSKVQNVCDFKNARKRHFLNIDFNQKITLRTRREGDLFSPFGMKQGKMKLKDYLINKKIPRQKRDNLLLLACGNEILCILGVQISQKAAVKKGESCYKLEILE